jgi:hypothetical protein
MHKRMMQLSARVAALGSGATARMQELLHLAQANDAYWHGLFGGIYLPHLRRGIWNSIVELEALLDRAVPRASRRMDLDLDGHDELFIGNDILQAVLRDDGLGAIHELDAYRLRHNFGDTLARRSEHYYRRIREGSKSEQHSGEGIASAHDRVNFRHPVAPEDLDPDPVPRSLFIDRLDGSLVAYGIGEAGTANVKLTSEKMQKHIAVEGNRLTVEYRSQAAAGTLEIEINLAMPSCDGFLGRYSLGGSVPGGLGDTFDWKDVTSLVLEDGVLGGKISLGADRPVVIHAAPHKTVSQSEDGFEKIMQAVTLRLSLAASATPFRIILAVE